MKIAIIGNAGSGKSTLALALHKKLNIPLYHLDQYQWLPNWKKRDKKEFEQLHKNLCDKPAWIIEGIATRLLDYRIAQSDVVIFLDIPRSTCLWRIFKRAFFNFGKVQCAGPEGCKEGYPSLEFLKYIVKFNSSVKPTILQILKKYEGSKKIIIISNQRDLDTVITHF